MPLAAATDAFRGRGCEMIQIRREIAPGAVQTPRDGRERGAASVHGDEGYAGLEDLARVGPTTPTRATARASEPPPGSVPKVAHASQQWWM